MVKRDLVMATTLCVLRPSLAFLSVALTARRITSTRFFGSAFSSSTMAAVESSVSRLGTLETLLSKHGAPGSRYCNKADDLAPIELSLSSSSSAPELVSALAGGGADEPLDNLHPYLYPIAQSKSSPSHFICAYRNPFVQDAKIPWPIVETQIGGPGMQILALSSEHLMRRIVCECDFSGTHQDLIQLYNEGLGGRKEREEGKRMAVVQTALLDEPYRSGSVQQLGYGLDKYVLLRVGPFADLYQRMSHQHVQKGDEQSALISAEACNSKLSGFGSNFAFYAHLLSQFPNRKEETRDAARMCLRLPLPTMGLELDDMKQVAVLGQLADETDSTKVALQKIKVMYEKMRDVEREEDPNQGKTPEQVAIDEANYILDMAVLDGKEWSSVRPEVGERLRSAGLDEMADFVDSIKK